MIALRGQGAKRPFRANGPGGFCASRELASGFYPLPKAKATEEGIGIVSAAATLWQFGQLPGIASPQYHVVQVKGRDEASHGVIDVFSPLLLAQPL